MNSIPSLLPNDLPEYWIYAVNVSYDQDEDQVRNFFSQSGQVVGLSFIYDRNGSKKGHVRVAYRKKEDAIRAISELHNMRYAGRLVKLNWDKSMVIRNSGASPEKVSELLRKSENNRHVAYESENWTEAELDEFVNKNPTSYEFTFSKPIDRHQTNAYQLLYQKQINPSNFPYRIPKSV